MSELKTGIEWNKKDDRLVLYPDGWDKTDFTYSWSKEAISKGEYNSRMSRSLCRQRTKKMKKINIITIHGIRDDGAELEAAALEALQALPDDGYSHGMVTPVDYPFVYAISHHIPFVRKVIEWGLARRLHEIALLYPDFEHVVMAHSNGTRALSRVLETAKNYVNIKSYTDFKIKKILLFGSIIPRNYDWSRFGRTFEVVNFVATKDNVVLFSKGWSGRYGFKDPAINVKEYRFKGGHSDYHKLMMSEILKEVGDA